MAYLSILVLFMLQYETAPLKVNNLFKIVATGISALCIQISVHQDAFASDDPFQLIQEGMTQFRRGDIEGSMRAFDKATGISPNLESYLWQRGLTQYFNKDYIGCSKQFRLDVSKKPKDTEEFAWAFLCDAQIEGVEKAREEMGRPTGVDPRPIMSPVYSVFHGDQPPDALRIQGDLSSPSSSEYFYSRLYTSLLYDVLLDEKEAGINIKEAMESAYSRKYGASDYMVSVARAQAERLAGR